MKNISFYGKLNFFIVTLFSTIPVYAQEAVQTVQTTSTKDTLFLSSLKKFIELIIEGGVKYGFQVFGGMIVLIIGWILGNYVEKLVKQFLNKKHIDLTVTKFLGLLSKWIVVAMALLVALGKFGIEIAPFIAGLSVIGFATSFALQGPLSNYAAGATLIFTKPFKVGDIIEVAGVVGEVEDMTLPRTEIRTVDGTKYYVPNKHIIGEIIHNFSEFKRVDIDVGVSYNTDVDKAIRAINKVLKSEARVMTTPEPRVGISAFADSAINLHGRFWTKQVNYWEVLFDVNKAILAEFNKNDIVIPFPQRDVYLYQKKD